MAVEMHRKMDESIRLEEAYMVWAKQEASAMQGRGDHSKRKNDEVVSKDDLSPLPEKNQKRVIADRATATKTERKLREKIFNTKARKISLVKSSTMGANMKARILISMNKSILVID
jgi:hypothetical protein